jgi:hypothetical protein
VSVAAFSNSALVGPAGSGVGAFGFAASVAAAGAPASVAR